MGACRSELPFTEICDRFPPMENTLEFNRLCIGIEMRSHPFVADPVLVVGLIAPPSAAFCPLQMGLAEWQLQTQWHPTRHRTSSGRAAMSLRDVRVSRTCPVVRAVASDTGDTRLVCSFAVQRLLKLNRDHSLRNLGLLLGLQAVAAPHRQVVRSRQNGCLLPGLSTTSGQCPKCRSHS